MLESPGGDPFAGGLLPKLKSREYTAVKQRSSIHELIVLSN
jgi:hypothetical protein